MCSYANIIIFVCFRFWIYNIFVFTGFLAEHVIAIYRLSSVTADCWIEFHYHPVLLDCSHLNNNNVEEENFNLQLNTQI